MPLFARIDSSSEEFVTDAPSEHQDEKNSLQIQRRKSPSVAKDRSKEKGNAENDDVDDDNNEEVEEGSSSPAGSAGFFQLLQAMTGARVQASSDNESSDGILGLLAQLGMVAREFGLRFSASDHQPPTMFRDA